jgi:hypothetical protein
LEKIKRERAEKREQEVSTIYQGENAVQYLTMIVQEREKAAAEEAEREKAAAEEAEREHDIALGNPLLNPKTDFNVKRRWDDDVIFKNQARGTDDKNKKKEFVNVSFNLNVSRKHTDLHLGFTSIGFP